MMYRTRKVRRALFLASAKADWFTGGAATSAKTHTLQLPGRTASDSSGASSNGSSRRSKRRRETTPVDDGEQEKILIVLLDEKDKDSKGDTKGMPDDDSTWHGCVFLARTRYT